MIFSTYLPITSAIVVKVVHTIAQFVEVFAQHGYTEVVQDGRDGRIEEERDVHEGAETGREVSLHVVHHRDHGGDVEQEERDHNEQCGSHRASLVQHHVRVEILRHLGDVRDGPYC